MQEELPNGSTTHVVGHLLREVESAARDVLVRSPAVAAELSRLTRKKQGKKRRHTFEISAILVGFGLVTDDKARAWIEFADDGSWATASHRDALRSPRKPTDEFVARFDLFVDVLGSVLDAAESQYARVLHHLEEILIESEPTAEDLDLVATHLGTGVTALAPVFNQLSHTWLVPLRDRGLFRDPPSVRTYQDGSFSLPRWPQVDYLARIAPAAPEEVLATIESLPPTDNDSIHVGLLDAVTRLPAPFSSRVALLEIPWIESHRWRHGLLADKIIEVIESLIAQGESGTALALLQVALSFPTEPTRLRTPIAPHSRMPEWTYKRMLQNLVPTLSDQDPGLTRTILIGLLGAGAEQASPYWRTSIEDHEQNLVTSSLDALLATVRSLYEDQVSKGIIGLEAAVEELERSDKMVHRRLALHLLRLFGDSTPALVEARLTDQTLLETLPAYHEVRILLRDRFGTLTQAAQAAVIKSLRENASALHIRAAQLREGMNLEEIERRSESRWLHWLAVLGRSRPPELEAEYTSLARVHGTPAHPSHYAWVEHVRPPLSAGKTATELLALSDTELVQCLISSSPGKSLWEGEARDIHTAVVRDPIRMAQLAWQLNEIHPSFAAELLRGVHESAGSMPELRESFDWPSLLQLAEAQTAAAGNDGANRSWACMCAAEITADIAKYCDSMDVVRRAWTTLSKLLAHVDPDNERSHAESSDADTLSLNSTRGIALYSAIEFLHALGKRPLPGEDFVKRVSLEVAARASPEVEPSSAIRAVLSRHLSLFFTLDSAMASHVAATLFGPTAPGRADAWRAFILWNNPSEATYRLLKDEYSAASARSGEDDLDVVEALGVHLLTLAAWDVIALDADHSPLEIFCRRANARARRHALGVLGRDLHGPVKLPAAHIERLKVVFDWWLKQSAQNREPGEDLPAFGWWFSSNVFDSTWALSTLAKVLKLTHGTIEFEHKVCEMLQDFAVSHPQVVIQCLGRAVRNGGPLIHRCEAAIRATLVALAATVEAGAAKDLASRLVAHGYLSFRDIA